MKLFFMLALAVFFFGSISHVQAIEYKCSPNVAFQQYACEGDLEVTTLLQLNAYLANYGLTNGKLKNLILKFNPNSTTDLNITSHCKVTIAKNLQLNTNNLCIHGEKGVVIDQNAKFYSQDLRIESGRDFTVAQNLILNANNLEFFTNSISPFGNIIIDQNAHINAQNFRMSSSGKINFAQNSEIAIAGNLQISSRGDGSYVFGKNAHINANVIDIATWPSFKVDKNAIITATSKLILNGDACVIGQNVQINAPIKSGDCYPGSVTYVRFDVDASSGVVPLIVNFDATEILGVTSYEWTFGDGQTFTSGEDHTTHTYSTSGTFTAALKYISNNDGVWRSGGSKQIIVESHVNMAPIPLISCIVTNLLVNCNGLGSYDPEGSLLSYRFNFGDEEIITNETGLATHAFALGGLYDVSLTVTDSEGMSATIHTNVQAVTATNVVPVAVLDCTSNITNQIECNPNGSSDSDGTIVNYKYEFDDGAVVENASAESVSHTFSTAGEHSVTLSVTDNDGDVTSVESMFIVKANSNPVAQFTCVSSSLFHVSCSSTSFDPDAPNDVIQELIWDFGNGETVSVTSSNVIEYQFVGGGLVNITLTAKDSFGATNSDTKSVMIKDNTAPVAVVGCTTNNLLVNCDGLSSYDFEGQALTYQFVYGDGFIEENSTGISSHAFTEAGTFPVSLIVRDILGGEGQTSTIVMPVMPPNVSPLAHLSCTSPSPLKLVCLSSGSSDSDGSIVSYRYQWDDGASDLKSDQSEIVHRFETAGNHQVTLVVTDNDGGVSTHSQGFMVKSNTLPVANFNCEPNYQNLKIRCHSLSSEVDLDDSITSAEWSFGNGESVSGTQESVEYLYASAGAYTVKLEVRDSNGGSASLIKTFTILDSHTPEISFQYPTGYNFQANEGQNFIITVSDDEHINNGSVVLGINDNLVSTAYYAVNSGNNQIQVNLPRSSYFKKGPNIVNVSVTTQNGLTTTASIVYNLLDNSPPVISFSPSENFTFTTSNGQIEITVTDPSRVDWSTLVLKREDVPVDSSLFTKEGNKIVLDVGSSELLDSGSNNFYISISDVEGNNTVKNFSYMFDPSDISFDFVPGTNARLESADDFVSVYPVAQEGSALNWPSFKVYRNGVELTGSEITQSDEKVSVPMDLTTLRSGTIKVSMLDIEGNTAVGEARYRLKDILPPEISFSVPDGAEIFNTISPDIKIELVDDSFIDESQITINLNGVDLPVNNYIYDSETKQISLRLTKSYFAGLGQNILLVSASDSEGNFSEKNLNFTITDNEGPTLNFTPQLLSSFVTNWNTVAFQVNDISDVNWQSLRMDLNGVPVPMIYFSIAENNVIINFNPDFSFELGENHINVVVEDILGNSRSVAAAYHLLEKRPPQISFTPDRRARFLSLPQTIVAKLNFPSTIDWNSLKFKVNNFVVTSWSQTSSDTVSLELDPSSHLVQGTNLVAVSFKNTDGAQNNELVPYFLDDLAAPTLNVNPQNGFQFSAQQASISLEALDAGGIDWNSLTLKLNNQTVSSDKYKIYGNVANASLRLNPGLNELVASIKDKSGKLTQVTRTYRVLDTLGPKYKFNPTHWSSFQTGMTHEFRVSITDDSGVKADSISVWLNGILLPQSVLNWSESESELVVSLNSTYKLNGGNNVVKVSSKDTLNHSSIASVSYKLIDVSAPTLAFYPVAGTEFLNNKTPSIKVSFEDDSNIAFANARFYLNSVLIDQSQVTIDASDKHLLVSLSVQNLKLGSNEFKAVIDDVAGNSAIQVVTYNLVDSVKPTISYQPASGASFNTLTQSIALNFTDLTEIDWTSLALKLNDEAIVGAIYFRFNNQVILNFTENFSMAQGDNLIEVELKDLSGNTLVSSATYHLDDIFPATFEFLPVSGTTLTTLTTPVSIAVNDLGELNWSSLVLKLNGETLPSSQYEVNASSIELFLTSNYAFNKGLNFIEVAVADASGNLGQASISYLVLPSGNDLVAPQISFNVPDGEVEPTLQKVTVSLSDATGVEFRKVRMWLNGVLVPAGNLSVNALTSKVDVNFDNIFKLVPGRNLLTVHAADKLNNVNGKTAYYELVSQQAHDTIPPVVTFTPGGGELISNTPTVQAFLSDESGVDYSTLQIFLNDILVDQEIVTIDNVHGKVILGFNPSHTLPDMESNIISIKVSDTQGNESLSKVGFNRIADNNYQVIMYGPTGAGGGNFCSILEGGLLRCWGVNGTGNSGLGMTGSIGIVQYPSDVPLVQTGEPVKSVSTGFHACTVTVKGHLLCWGSNSKGELGYGHINTIGDNELPITQGYVDVGEKVVKVSVGVSHTCVVLESGDIKCWGDNTFGQLGRSSPDVIGDDELPSSIPKISFGAKVLQIVSTQLNNCVLLETGKVKCFGHGVRGANGYGVNTNTAGISASLPDVSLNGLVKEISANTHGHTVCAILTDDRLNCWGLNSNGQLGYGNTQIVGDNELPSSKGTVSVGGPVRKVALGTTHVCAILYSGEVRCWGTSESESNGFTFDVGDNELPSSVAPLNFGNGIAADLVLGLNSTCVIYEDGTQKCWGANTGNLGQKTVGPIGVAAFPALPPIRLGGKVQFSEVSRQSELSLGESHTCSILPSGIKCWGQGGAGYLGYGNTHDIGDNEYPSSVGSVNVGGTPKEVVNGISHSCALLFGGGVKCWGENGLGQLGLGHIDTIGDNELPVASPVINLGGAAKRLASGDNHTCALKTDNSISCWGQGAFGKLGYGNTDNIGDDELPVVAGNVDVGTTTEIKQVITGDAHTCILTKAGSVKCWGSNQYYQLGFGSLGDVIGDNETPASIAFLNFGETVLQIAAGKDHNCALLQSNRIKCWGRNDEGQLGLGHTNQLTSTMLALPFVTVGENSRFVSAGGANTCAITVTDKARCWGRNAEGQLGLGNTFAIGDNETPSTVAAINLGAPILKIDTSGRFTCAVILNGDYYCWGQSLHGELGYGNTNTIGDNELPLTAGIINLGGGTLFAKFSVSQYFGPSPFFVEFNGSESFGSESSIVNYHWDFGDGSVTDETSGHASHIYPNNGVYQVRLTIRDDINHETSFSRTLTVGALNNPPFASFSLAKSFGVAPFIANFNASASFDANGTISKYYWDFGDGQNAMVTTSSTTHTYSQPGAYLATLKVEDNAGVQVSAFPQAITVKEFNTQPFNNFDCTRNGKSFSCNAKASADMDGYITNYRWEVSDGRIFEGATLSSINSNFVEDGQYSVKLIVTDDNAGTTSLTKSLNVDSISPEISIDVADNVLTNSTQFSFTVTVIEQHPGITKVFKNGTQVAASGNTILNLNVNLSEGNNVFTAESTDESGNVSTKNLLSHIVLDSTAPILTSSSPAEGQEIRTQNIPVQGSFNEKVTSVSVNGEPAVLSEDSRSFTYALTTYVEDDQLLNIAFTDLAGNSGSHSLRFPIVFNVLYPDLISVSRDENNQLRVSGVQGATRGGSDVHVEAGFFNQNSVTSNTDGSFELVLDYFTSAQITVTNNGRVENAILNFNADTTLAGTIQDTDGNPLPGVEIKIKDTDIPPAVTNAAGIFTFSNPPTGDRQLIVDAQRIPESVIGSIKKFSVLEIPIRVVSRQSNVLDKVIHLAPLLHDGTEVVIVNGEGVSFESAHVQGAGINIPASVQVQFPEGNSANAINMMEIQKDKTTVPVLKEAEPDTVIALEPSGLTFSEPVDLTLPNVNELPAKMQVVIYSKNSKNGNWEIDGIARVSEDGQSIQTEEGKGITHFSEVYAAPLGLKYKQINPQDKPGIDTVGGGVSTSIDFPGYKALGSEIAPKLLYKSNWAHPTAVVTNMFQIPEEVTFLNADGSRTLAPIENQLGYLKTWVIPESVEVGFIAGDYHSPPMTLVGNPNGAVISLGMDFQNQSTGVMPFAANYVINLKRMVVRTKIEVKGNTFDYKVVVKETPPESMKEAIPSELRGQVYIQNKSNSSVGRGWMIGGVQKIVNPSASRIMLEEGDGSVSTYVVDDKIQTLAKIPEGFAGISPVKSSKLIVAGNKDDLYNLDLETGNLSKDFSAIQFTGQYRSSVVIKRRECIAWTKVAGHKICAAKGDKFYCQQKVSNYQATPTKNYSILSPDGSGYIIASEKGLITTNNNGNQVLAGNTKNAPSSTENPMFCAGDAKCTNTRIVEDYRTNGFCPPRFPSSGSYYDLATSDIDGNLTDARFGTIKSIAASLTSNGFAVADYGNNKVKFVDLDTRKVSILAGNAVNDNAGTGGVASEASIKRPQGLVYDEDGNLYVSTEDGYIKKIDRSGRISNYAGNPNGAFYDSGKASEMYLSRPYGLVIDHVKSYLYVADTGNNRILQIDLITNLARTVAGNGLCQVETSVAEYGAALGSSLCNPEFVAVDENHNLLIADTGHKKIKRVIFANSESGILKYASVAEDNSTLERNLNKTFTRTFRNGIKMNFDSFGRQLSTVDLTGKIVRYEYDSEGKLLEQIDPVGGVISYAYENGDGRLSSIRYEGDQREFNFFYESNGDLASVNYPDGTSKKFSYSSDGLLLEELDALNHPIQYEYNDWFRVSKIIRPDGKFISFLDSTDKNLVNGATAEDPNELKPYGKDDGQLVDGIKDAKGITTTFLKDESGYVNTITDGDGKETFVERDLKGRPTKITRPDLSVVQLVYDLNNGDLLSRYDSSTEKRQKYTYNGLGQLIMTEDGEGRRMINEYNSKGLLTRTINEVLGVTVNYSYNSFGLLTSQTDSLGNVSHVTYDSQGNVQSSVNPQGKETKYFYYPSGLVQQVIDSNLNTKNYEHDSMNRLIAVTTGENERTQYSYFENGELKQINDPYNTETKFLYNSLGLLIQKIGARGEVVNLTYDDNGNVASETTPKGDLKIFEYDNLNRLIRKTLPDDQYEFGYDIRGNLTELSNHASELEFTYQHFDGGDVVSQVKFKGVGQYANLPQSILNYVYNEAGERLSTATPIGTFNYGRDSAGRLRSITNPEGKTFSLTYDLNQRPSMISGPAMDTSFEFDSIGFNTKINHTRKSGATIERFIYGRDHAGNRTSKTTLAGTSQYSYDKNYQLIQAITPNLPQEDFSYDKIGNRTQDNHTSYVYDSKKQQIQEDFKYLYVFDLNGNLISKQEKNFTGNIQNFEYSSENQLKKFKLYENGTLVKEVAYTYDALGRRVEKEVADLQDSSKSFTRRYLYDGSEILAEYNENNALLNSYTHSTLSTDDPLSVINPQGTFYFVKDALGSVTDITDSNGLKVQHYEYTSFGKLALITDGVGNDITSNPVIDSYFTYTGREYDKETGLYYYRARYYDSQIGRFISSDPDSGLKIEPRTFNSKYSYVANNAINSVDPSGEQSVFDQIGKRIARNVDAAYGNLSRNLELIGVKVPPAQLMKATLILAATAGVIVGASTGNPTLTASSAAVLFVNVNNFNSNNSRSASSVLWNSTKVAIVAACVASFGELAGPIAGLLVGPATYAGSKYVGVSDEDATMAGWGAGLGFVGGYFNQSTPPPTSGSGTSKTGGYNKAGTWESPK